VVSEASIRGLEELAMNALPALESELFDGWILRAAGGYTGRANSAAPLYPGELEAAEKVGHTETWFRSRGLTPMIRLTAAAQPTNLESVLADRGYRLRDEGVSVQICSLEGEVPSVDGIEITEGRVPESWLMAMAGFQPKVAPQLGVVRSLFSRLPAASAYALISSEGTPAAIGRAVFQHGHVGLFDIFTRRDLRRRGLAGGITRTLLAWGVRNGATGAYLQVVPSNTAACHLYAGLGFNESYRYWYRVAPHQVDGGKWKVGKPDTALGSESTNEKAVDRIWDQPGRC
jgi:ribosomal protein S18 acetylase RimI-like enzyme